MINDGVHRCPDGPAFVEHIVDDDDLLACKIHVE